MSILDPISLTESLGNLRFGIRFPFASRHYCGSSFPSSLPLAEDALHGRVVGPAEVVLDQAQRTKRTGAKDFFNSILSAAAQTSRDPDQFSKKPNQNLGELGILAEFLDDLPYRSSIMRLTEEDWYRLSLGEQQAVINNLKSKIKRYSQIHDDVANWTSFGAQEPGDAVYRVPLSLMP